jgi:hypothetical protein
VVRYGRSRLIGALYLENERVVVVLNTVSSAADLGELKTIREEHVEPEADIWVFPRDQVTVQRLEERRSAR